MSDTCPKPEVELCPGGCGKEPKRHLDSWWQCDTYRQLDGVVVQSDSCIELAALRSQLTAATARAEAMEKFLRSAIERMDRARGILTGGNPTWGCNWGMLDTSDLLAPAEKEVRDGE